ncbi:NAD(P)/FAD-dependent oxidoreductase [Dyadobacter bucti]|uniref:NAD(P)/FAD-dependent oxidoreductase n=1 Tax=Dyadobacter bucti TaxID=2572203 RepID=UPI001108F41D|nr:NAD(P)/FAD-dependent oxidoreductase [Dyadobacter bucti]
METTEENIIIIGGGFGGINLAKELLNNPLQGQVILVDRNNYNFFPPLLYQVATGFLDVSGISYPYRRLFRNHSNFHFRMGELLEIKPDNNTVVLSTGELHYSKLVLATGTESNFFGNNNVKKHALPMKTVADAIYLKNAILERFELATRTTDLVERQKLTTIVVAGGGPTGVEIAGMLSELKANVLEKDYPELSGLPFDIYLIDGLPTLLGPMSKESQQYTHKSLEAMGIKIKLNELVKDFDGDSVLLGSGTSIATRNLLWTAGVTAHVFEGLPNEVYGRGKRLIVDEFNMVTGTSNIYAIGDTCIQTTDQPFPNGHPQLAQVAIQQGRNLAHNIHLARRQQAMKPFYYNDKGSMAIIGRNKAVADLAKPHAHFEGFLAWLMWLFIHLLSLINVRNKIKTFASWVSAYLTKDQYLRMIIRPEQKDSNTGSAKAEQ